MTSIFKKSLACCLAVVLCLTCMLGALTVSAAEVKKGTFTVENATVTPGTASADVKVTINADAANVIIMQVEVDPEDGEVTAVRAEDSAMQVVMDATTKKIYVSNGDSNIAPFESVVIYVTVALADTTTEAEYDVTAKLVSAASNIEDEFEIADVTGKIIVAAAEAPHVHDYEGAVAYMDTTDGKWYKDCNSCDEREETDAVVIDGYLLEPSILFTESVGMIISVNRAAGSKSITALGYSSDYYFEVKYDSYDNSYMKQPTFDTFLADEWEVQSNGGLVDRFYFTSLRLFEMAFDFDVVLYLKDAEGRVVATHTQTYNICDQALLYAQTAKASNDEVLLKAIVDMVNYGATVQEYFAKSNTTSDIATAALPTVGFENYQYCASTEADLPESFDTTSKYNKLVDSTSIVFDVPSVMVGASTSFKHYMMASVADIANLKLIATYTNAYGEPVVVEAPASEWEVVNAGRSIYAYTFKKLALYDLDKTVTVTVYYNNVAECNYEYNVGNFATTYIDDADLGDVVVAMELFAQSAKAAIVR